ncbi:bifunctional nuclease family protein [Candidatus Giovannonibacteria bacterium]|nr:bifunctional nuclease family protein [Candidatus Giovannonibacteria bacterium]
MEVEVECRGVYSDENVPHIVLERKNSRGSVFLLIPIEKEEEPTISMMLVGTIMPRPLIYDLIKIICDEIGGAVGITKITITEIRENIFFSSVYFTKRNGRTVVMEAQAKDAAILAKKFKCPLYVEDSLLAEFVEAELED